MNNDGNQLPAGLPDSAMNNPILRAFLEGESVMLDQPLGFNCRGCGLKCCVNQDILVTPPEALRLAWAAQENEALMAHLSRHRLHWLDVMDGGSSGLPVGMIHFVPVATGVTVCPFLAVDAKNPGQAVCAARDGRPGACRIYPLGRMSVTDRAETDRTSDEWVRAQGAPDTWEWRVIARCAGFQAPAAGEPLPPGYRAAPEGQTARQWLAGQMDERIEYEKNFYLHQITKAYMEAHLHVPTNDCPGGRISSNGAFQVLAQAFYGAALRPVPHSGDPAEDHETVMRFLRGLVSLVDVFRRATDEAERETVALGLQRVSGGEAPSVICLPAPSQVKTDA